MSFGYISNALQRRVTRKETVEAHSVKNTYIYIYIVIIPSISGALGKFSNNLIIYAGLGSGFPFR